MRRFARLSGLFLSAVVSLSLCAGADAAPITIGQVAPANPSTICTSGPTDLYQVTVASGPSYAVPASGGVLTSWSTNAGAGGGQMLKMKVFRHVSGSTYSVVGHDGPRTLTPSTLNTFPISIPVQAGDFIALNDQNVETVHNACLFTSSPGDVFGAGKLGMDPGDGATAELFPAVGGFKVNVSATLQPRPTITSFSPSSGSVKGGTKVTITGTDFEGATAVNFGAAAAPSFTIDSESQITAVAPPSAFPGLSTVTVTTVAGKATASSALLFNYTACVVPKLAGQKLKAAKKKLKKAECKIGKVKLLGKATPQTGKVKKQNPKPGKVLAPGSKVSVKLG